MSEYWEIIMGRKLNINNDYNKLKNVEFKSEKRKYKLKLYKIDGSGKSGHN